ncbi:hypothetical protein EON83_02690 [bacterium]|nr:MAG: hypothetical protein EON83_02690 [bacterium]
MNHSRFLLPIAGVVCLATVCSAPVRAQELRSMRQSFQTSGQVSWGDQKQSVQRVRIELDENGDARLKFDGQTRDTNWGWREGDWQNWNANQEVDGVWVSDQDGVTIGLRKGFGNQTLVGIAHISLQGTVAAPRPVEITLDGVVTRSPWETKTITGRLLFDGADPNGNQNGGIVPNPVQNNRLTEYTTVKSGTGEFTDNGQAIQLSSANVQLNRDGTAKIVLAGPRNYIFGGQWRQTEANRLELRLDSFATQADRRVFDVPRPDPNAEPLGGGEIRLDGTRMLLLRLGGQQGTREFDAYFEPEGANGAGWDNTDDGWNGGIDGGWVDRGNTDDGTWDGGTNPPIYNPPIYNPPVYVPPVYVPPVYVPPVYVPPTRPGGWNGGWHGGGGGRPGGWNGGGGRPGGWNGNGNGGGTRPGTPRGSWSGWTGEGVPGSIGPKGNLPPVPPKTPIKDPNKEYDKKWGWVAPSLRPPRPTAPTAPQPPRNNPQPNQPTQTSPQPQPERPSAPTNTNTGGTTWEKPREESPRPRVEPPREESPKPRVDPPREESPRPRVERPREESPKPRVDPPREESPKPRVDPPREEKPKPREEAPKPREEKPKEEKPKEEPRKDPSVDRDTRERPRGPGVTVRRGG